MLQPLTTSPLNVPFAIREVIHMVHGQRLREALPEVQLELDTAENSAVQDYVDDMESEDEAGG